MANIFLRRAEQKDISKIAPYLIEFKLDTENISVEQFIIAEIEGELAGFGRIKPYENLYELSSVGVLFEYRNKGIGEKLIKHLIDVCPSQNIWIATKIADYFKKFGFQEADEIPDEIIQKSQRLCLSVSGSIEGMSYMLLKKNP